MVDTWTRICGVKKRKMKLFFYILAYLESSFSYKMTGCREKSRRRRRSMRRMGEEGGEVGTGRKDVVEVKKWKNICHLFVLLLFSLLSPLRIQYTYNICYHASLCICLAMPVQPLRMTMLIVYFFLWQTIRGCYVTFYYFSFKIEVTTNSFQFSLLLHFSLHSICVFRYLVKGKHKKKIKENSSPHFSSLFSMWKTWFLFHYIHCDNV